MQSTLLNKLNLIDDKNAIWCLIIVSARSCFHQVHQLLHKHQDHGQLFLFELLYVIEKSVSGVGIVLHIFLYFLFYF